MSWHYVQPYEPIEHMKHRLKFQVVVIHAYYRPLLTKVLAQLFLVSSLRVVLNFPVY